MHSGAVTASTPSGPPPARDMGKRSTLVGLPPDPLSTAMSKPGPPGVAAMAPVTTQQVGQAAVVARLRYVELELKELTAKLTRTASELQQKRTAEPDTDLVRRLEALEKDDSDKRTSRDLEAVAKAAQLEERLDALVDSLSSRIGGVIEEIVPISDPAQILALETGLGKATESVADLRTQLAAIEGVRSSVEIAKEALDELAGRVAELESAAVPSDLVARLEALESAPRASSELGGRVEALESANSAATELVARLEALETAPALPPEVAARLEALENTAPAGMPPELLARLEALESSTAVLESSTAVPTANPEASTGGVSEDVVAGLLQRIDALEASAKASGKSAPKSKSAEKAAKPSANPVATDLQRVKGIGKSWAQKLAAAGVESVEAVARWSDEDVARLAKSLSVAAKKLKGWRTAAKDV